MHLVLIDTEAQLAVRYDGRKRGEVAEVNTALLTPEVVEEFRVSPPELESDQDISKKADEA